MSDLWLVMRTVYRAAGFVMDNKGACFYRAIPIIIALIVLGLLQLVVAFQFGLASNVAEFYSFFQFIASPCLYSIFAVSWHRFTILPEERTRKGFPLRFGWRELKFSGVSIATTLVMSAAAVLFVATLPKAIAVILLLVLMIAIGVTLVFSFPAVALDQPIRPSLFLQKGFSLLISLTIAIVISTLYLLVLLFGFMIIMWIIGDIISLEIASIISYVGGNILLAPILLAITTSTASFLFQDVIGLKEDKSTDPERTATT